MVERKKPNFVRRDWHKKIKLGSTVKKNRKWKGAKGRHNKIRLCMKGHSARPKIGWGTAKKEDFFRVENLKDLENVGKKKEILIGKVGLKKRKEIIEQANKMKLKVMNKYKKLGSENKEVKKDAVS